jgi:hypothetical protein
MSGGRIMGAGTYAELSSGNTAFAELVRTADTSGKAELRLLSGGSLTR